ncbi:hypothetical protein AG1IA_02369 [Rhizoctonia solani AG-1 IA]|uniref:Uncharacterized protein n=1 Tax=Thanatephorus cucumeris (strain AG1-IA) TaxID=983506 RepID=L8X3A4_THACA|nr:hypothetical protein AG1IA_02369 [Rhizoctonia solani AG-1 IA]
MRTWYGSFSTNGWHGGLELMEMVNHRGDFKFGDLQTICSVHVSWLGSAGRYSPSSSSIYFSHLGHFILPPRSFRYSLPI